MPGTAKIIGSGVFIHAHSCCIAALLRRDSGSCVHVVDGNGESGAVIIRIVIHHLRQLQFLAVIAAHRHTDEPFAMYRHKIDVFGGREFRGADEVPLVFTIRIIGTENDFTQAKIF